MKAHAAAAGEKEDLLWWDVAFWAERLREAKYDLKDEELRPYFALPAVLDGLFKVCLFVFGGGSGVDSLSLYILSLCLYPHTGVYVPILYISSHSL